MAGFDFRLIKSGSSFIATMFFSTTGTYFLASQYRGRGKLGKSIS
jgi:hypothetical protein